jgi:hypothetical protein
VKPHTTTRRFLWLWLVLIAVAIAVATFLVIYACTNPH